ncbi:MAG: BatD family protein [Phycisphaerales bacterium]|jgi:hypothetical protein|nr:BatD family protein [Phycisphaerales bacterium]
MRSTQGTQRIGSLVWHVALCALISLASAASAGTVRQSVSSRTGYTGAPITLELLFENVQSHEVPVIPDVSGLKITSAGAPSTMTSTTIINGRSTHQSTLTYRYLITAAESGTWELPAIDLHADDAIWQTEPMMLTFESSADRSLLQSQLINVPETAWLGDILPLTLRILVKPYRDAQLPDGVLSATDMWGQIQFDASTWGPFREQIATLAQDRRYPPLSVVQVPGEQGPERWYAFDISTDVPLIQAGPLDLSDISIAMNYPLRIGRGRESLFTPFPQLRVIDRRLVTSTPPPAELLVQTPPEQGRPEAWAGAVGRFRIDVSASHTDAEVGEPITLTMTISDVGPHPADLELLQAPRLDADKALATHFRVPADRPGGVVSGRSKTFTQTIRPTSAGVDLIPPIPFTYFDPSTERYDTAFSRPIDIHVTAAAQMDASDVGGVAAAAPNPTRVAAVQSGLLANYTDPNLLLQRNRPAGAAMLAAVVIAPPMLFLLVVLFRWRKDRDQSNPNRARNRQAGRRLDARLSEAGTAPDAVAAAVRAYIADRAGLPAEGLTNHEAIAAVRGAGHESLAGEMDAILRDLETKSYAGAGGPIHATQLADVRSTCKRLGEVM